MDRRVDDIVEGCIGVGAELLLHKAILRERLRRVSGNLQQIRLDEIVVQTLQRIRRSFTPGILQPQPGFPRILRGDRRERLGKLPRFGDSNVAADVEDPVLFVG